ncbi:MAG: 1-deoxy-D-xylulose-5-phosphate synthase [Thiohalomonadales bacterium]
MIKNSIYPLLSEIDSPANLRDLSPDSLQQLADELRSFTIDLVSETGGHLASSLGTVELTIALHYIYNTPDDRLVWDVGHQAYPHKILTGRREQMITIRKEGGLSGFPKRSESEYDTFGVGHSSTSISAALGMAIAAQQQQIDRRVVAIIGDGAMTAGLAFEALNHAGVLDSNLLVILNDNEMSISPNVGGLSNYLAKVLSGSLYSTMREGSKKVLGTIPTVWELARRAEEHVKGMVVPGTLFEELGFNYIGPIDGHDLKTLITTLGNLRKLKGPQFLHIVTKKGKGFAPAEQNPCLYHGVGPFNRTTGEIKKSKPTGPSYTQIFSDWLCDMAKHDKNLVAITPAMLEGSGLVRFANEFPNRYFDVGIAEQHAITVAAGMACDGIKPVVAIYSTFLQRAYDQLVHDVAIQNLDILFAIDRAGLVGPDGPTHAGSFDLSFMRCIPNMTIMAPANEQECRLMLSTGFKYKGPCAVRYPRGTGPGVELNSSLDTIDIGKGEICRQGSKIAILSFGITLSAALEAAEILDATVVNMRFIKPLDTKLIQKIAQQHDVIVTIEDNAILGGAGSAVNECLAHCDIQIPIKILGLPDYFQQHASREALLVDACLDCNGIIKSVEGFLNHLTLTKHASLA